MIAIRPFVADDTQRLCEIFYRSVHEVASAEYTLEQLDAWVPAIPDDSRWVNDLLAVDTRVALDDDGAIIAWISMTPTGYLDMIFRLPEAAGTGGIELPRAQMSKRLLRGQ